MNIAVFCGSSFGNDPDFKIAATEFGSLAGKLGWQIVYGGASIGLMGTVADACLENGGRVHGVIPGFMRNKEIAHPKLTELTVTKNMHERKQVMAAEADIFVALPGGFGTFEEILEIITWRQLNLHKSPIGFLNVNGYFDGLLSFFEKARHSGFIRNPLDFYYHVWENVAGFERFAVRHAAELHPLSHNLFSRT